MDPKLRPPALPRLSGEERFSGGDATVLDFWQWAMGDLRMNNTRGHLAEFLVARAVGSPDPLRVEWAGHDVTTAAGHRLEVKASAYLQSWTQTRRSTPSFSTTGPTTVWDEATADWVTPPNGRVDLWVFCLHTAQTHAEYNPLAIDQWTFWVAPARVIDALGQKHASLSTVERVAGPRIAYAELAAAVDRAAAANHP